MAVATTVLIGALCTISALLSMFVFGVSGWTILQIYCVFCAALVVAGLATVTFPGNQNSETADSEEAGDFSNELSTSRAV